MLRVGLRSCPLPVLTGQAKLFSTFYADCQGKTELERIARAQQLISEFQDQGFPLSTLPAVPERQDWWFLIQVFALDRYVNKNGESLPFDLTDSSELWVEDFAEQAVLEGKLQPSTLWTALTAELPVVSQERTSMNSNQLTQLVDERQEVVLDKLGFSAQQYHLRLLYLDEYLRVSEQLSLGKTVLSTYLQGYRQRLDGQKSVVTTGNSKYGGVRFVDSWWPDTVHRRIIPRLAISVRPWAFTPFLFATTTTSPKVKSGSACSKSFPYRRALWF